MYTRLSKALLIWAVALYASLVVLGNLTDYDSNYAFVSHVLKMDTTFPGNRLTWRAIHLPSVHTAFYWIIIFTEAIVAALCWFGGWQLFRAANDPGRFKLSKGVAVAGLTLGMLLWFTGFITIGGEWFLMWQSAMWNGQEAAFRLVVILGIVLLYLMQPEADVES